MTGALDGLRVLEVAAGVAGPYAGRLLAMLGAMVVKIEPWGGDPARRLPVDDRPLAGAVSPVFVHLNAGKELASAGDVDMKERIAWADVFLDDRVRHEREGTALDPARLRAAGKIVVSMTAWGYDWERAGEPADELLVQAASGMGPATFEDGRPCRFPGWQSQYVAGAYGVAGLLTAMSIGDKAAAGHHVDVSWVGAIVTGVEAGVCAYLHAVEQPPRPPHEEGRAGGVGGRDRQAGSRSAPSPPARSAARTGT